MQPQEPASVRPHRVRVRLRADGRRARIRSDPGFWIRLCYQDRGTKRHQETETKNETYHDAHTRVRMHEHLRT